MSEKKYVKPAVVSLDDVAPVLGFSACSPTGTNPNWQYTCEMGSIADTLCRSGGSANTACQPSGSTAGANCWGTGTTAAQLCYAGLSASVSF